MKAKPDHGSAAIIIRGARLLTPVQYKVLKALVSYADYDMSVGFNYVGFKALSKRANMPRKAVRVACRALKRKGLAEYANGLFTEDGRLAGAGYAATREGKVVCDLKREKYGRKQTISDGSQRKTATAKRRLHSGD